MVQGRVKRWRREISDGGRGNGGGRGEWWRKREVVQEKVSDGGRKAELGKGAMVEGIMWRGGDGEAVEVDGGIG